MSTESNRIEIQLPKPLFSGAMSVEQAIKDRRSIRAFNGSVITLDSLGQILWAAQGITHGERFRAAPSAGARYPLELYVVAKNVTDLPAGVYKHDLQKHVLAKCVDGDFVAKLCIQPCVTQSSAVIVMCGVYERIAKKYGDRAAEYTHMEIGCVSQNIHLQATARNIGTVFVAGFDPVAVQAIIGASADEKPLCLMPLGNIE